MSVGKKEARAWAWGWRLWRWRQCGAWRAARRAWTAVRSEAVSLGWTSWLVLFALAVIALTLLFGGGGWRCELHVYSTPAGGA